MLFYNVYYTLGTKIANFVLGKMKKDEDFVPISIEYL